VRYRAVAKKSIDYSEMSELDRFVRIERIFVRYKRLTNLLEMIGHCHQYSKIAAEPWCLLITGWEGAGKTKVYEWYEQGFPRRDTEEGTVVPILTARIPPKANDKSLATILLKRLGDPLAEKGNRTNQTLRLYKLIEACGVELIILDEFQHFVDWDSLKIIKTVSDWLKNLIDETKKPIVLTGMPYSEVILNAVGNSQLKRRFSLRVSLDFFRWGTADEKKEFRGFLRMVDEKLPLNEFSNLSDPVMAYRLYCATNGVVAYVMKIVRRAAVLAIQRGRERVDCELLAEAFKELVQQENPKKVNPFSADPVTLRVEPFEHIAPTFKATSNGHTGRQKELTAYDVLR
jgi:hypothetical protein